MVLAEFFIPHGHCYLWKPGLVGLHLVSDALIALAYYSIPITLTYFITKRRDVPFNWIFLLFSAFIVFCGTTHILEIWTLWHPNYWLSGLVKALTAIISFYTATALIFLLPQALAIPSTAQLEKEIKERLRVEAALLKQKTHLAQAQKVAHVGSWEFDLATKEITWSDETFCIYGLNPEQPTPTITEHRQQIYPDDRPIWDATVTQLALGTSCELEFRIVRPDGSIRHILGQGKPLFNLDGQVYKLFGTVLDISDRILAQQRERLIGEIVLSIHHSLELQEILNTTVGQVRQFLETDRVLIYRFNPDWSGKIVVESVGTGFSAVLNTTINDPCFGSNYTQLYQQGRVRAIANIYTAGLQPCHVELLAPLQVTANLIVPILVSENLWGLLIVHHCREERQWQFNEIELLQKLATQLAIAIQQSELYSRVQSELIERQRIEQELRVSEQLYRSVVTAMSEGIVLQQADGKITACNASAERILGLSVEQMLRLTSNDFCWQTIYEDGSPFPGELHPAIVTLQTGEPQSNVIMGIQKPDESLTWIAINSQPLFHPAETKPHAVVTSFSDITDRKMAEEALRSITHQERQKAQQLERALQELQRTQAQLVQNEKMVSLGQLVAGVAHEINNPTSFIYGNIYPANEYAQDLLHIINLYTKHYREPVAEIAEQLKQLDIDFIVEDFPKLLGSIKEGAQRITEIVQSLRNFSRLDEVECKPVDIHQGIDSTLLILKHRLTQQPDRCEIQLIKEYAELPLVQCYPGQLNQVFMNIISNAIDAIANVDDAVKEENAPLLTCYCHETLADSPPSCNLPTCQPTNLQLKIPCIRIHTEVVEPNWVVIRITDNGPGIKADVQPRIFDPFFTTKPIGQGTGLGLSISYQIIVEKHGGKLSCYSAPGFGTEFAIKLPITQPSPLFRHDPIYGSRSITATRDEI
ncbi:MAG TPA: diguanylate cyclase [Cyanobacteria bacterium UBA8553]|nr:diguanylate cyclase [Cyanobacteria bacterium UBA8553]